MNISKAVKTMQTLTKAAHLGEEFPITTILAKIASILNENPTDKTAIGVTQVLQKKASHGNLFISRHDLRQLFNTYYSPTSSAKEALASELDLPKQDITSYQKADYYLDLNKAAQEIVDPALLHTFQKIASPKEASLIEKSISEQCQKTCYAELNRLGISCQIKFASGQDSLALCQASFSTHKGTTNFIIPIEIVQHRPLIPTFFLCNSGLVELSEKNLKLALARHAGEDLQFVPNQLLKVFASMKNLNSSSEVEQIVVKNKLMQAKASVANGITGLKVEEPIKQFDLKLPLTKEAQTISELLSSSRGEAEFKFGKDNVQLGAKLVGQCLSELGFKSAQIEVSASDKAQIFYKVALPGMKSFKVPVKIARNHPEVPSVLISEDGLATLSLESIAELKPSLEVTASFSNLKDLNDSELKDVVHQAMLNKNASKAEEALQILSYRKSSLLQSVFDIYLRGMQGNLDENKSRCSKPIKIANSSHILCGHLRVPLDKVYQDEFGHCCHLARKHIPKPETMAMSAHRIVL